MPAFNEEKFVSDVLQKVTSVLLDGQVEKEIVIVNDCSTDRTKLTIEQFILQNPSQKIKLITHEKNQGKGACIRTGLQYTSGEVLIIQDTDQEYDPT